MLLLYLENARIANPSDTIDKLEAVSGLESIRERCLLLDVLKERPELWDALTEMAHAIESL